MIELLQQTHSFIQTSLGQPFWHLEQVTARCLARINTNICVDRKCRGLITQKRVVLFPQIARKRQMRA